MTKRIIGAIVLCGLFSALARAETPAPVALPALAPPGKALPRPPTPPGLGLEGAELPERMTWDRTPIAVTLPVGIERQVRFPKPVKVGVPAPLQGVLRSQTVEGTVYWQARAPFETTRVLAKEIESGRTYLLDLKAVEGTGPATPIEVSPPAEQSQEAAPEAAAPAEGVAPGLVDLTRYAAQQLYAPARLLRDLPGVVRVPLRSVRSDRLLRGGEVEALPIAAWHGRDYYLTAVRLRNRTLRPLVLDPRDLRGQWLAATFQHARLLPRGSEADMTCVYLISARPFEESL